MAAVRMMQVTIDEIIDVVAVWDGGMSAIGTMDVVGRVAAATVRRRAGGRMGAVDRQFVLFDGAVGAGMMQVTLVQVVEVSLVFDRGMPAIGTVLVRVAGMFGGGHGMFLSGENEWDGPTRVRDFCNREVNRSLLGMFQGVGNHFRNVSIGQRVVDVLALAAMFDDAFGPQQLQPLRDGRQIVPEPIGKFRDTQVAARQQGQHLQPGCVPQGTENAGGSFAAFTVSLGQGAARVIRRQAFRDSDGHHIHSMNKTINESFD
jgi:hypothetical protein